MKKYKKIILIVIAVIAGIYLLLIAVDKAVETTGGDVKSLLSRSLKEADSKLLDFDYLGREISSRSEHCYFGARIKKPDSSKEYIIGDMSFYTNGNGKEDGDLEILGAYESKSEYKQMLKEYKEEINY